MSAKKRVIVTDGAPSRKAVYADEVGVLSRSEAEAIAKKALSFATGPQTVVHVTTENNRNTRMSRSEISTQRDNADGRVIIWSTNGTRQTEVRTQRFDDEGLQAAVKQAEDASKMGPADQAHSSPIKPRSIPSHPMLWSDATDAVGLAPRIQSAQAALGKTTNHIVAGSIDVASASTFVTNSNGLSAFARESRAQFTSTIRSSDNTGSGWAGNRVYDYGKLDTSAIADRALDKCERSRSPVAIEPGRYVAILEPAVMGDMFHYLMELQMDLTGAEKGRSVFTNPKGGTKIGLKMMDERLSLVSDPMDPDGPFRPFSDSGVPFERTHWIQDGILKNLSLDEQQARKQGREHALANPESVRLAPREGEKLNTLQEMIETCERGIYITRITTAFADFRYLVFTGVTRDGAWLIEKGKIVKPIKNMRYLESPFFILNNVEMMGKPELIPVGGLTHIQMVLPPVRVRDFNFTALADAV